MIHQDKAYFEDVIEKTAKIDFFDVRLIEKDYYLTLLMSRIEELSSSLVFKERT